jgi:hypothetical protein
MMRKTFLAAATAVLLSAAFLGQTTAQQSVCLDIQGRPTIELGRRFFDTETGELYECQSTGWVLIGRFEPRLEETPEPTPSPAPSPAAPTRETTPTPPQNTADSPAPATEPRQSDPDVPWGTVAVALGAIMGLVGVGGGGTTYIRMCLGRHGILRRVDSLQEVFIEDELGWRRWLPRSPRLRFNTVLEALGEHVAPLDAYLEIHDGSLVAEVSDPQDRIQINGHAAAQGRHQIWDRGKIAVDAILLEFVTDLERDSD